MKRKSSACSCEPCEGCGCYVDDYNAALDAVLKMLEGK